MTLSPRFLLPLVAAAASLMLTGCNTVLEESARTPLAQCIAKNVSAERAYALGESLSLSRNLGMTHWDAWGCEGFTSLLLNKDERTKVGVEVNAELLSRAEFRRGLYAGLGTIAMPHAQRRVLGGIGMELEKNVTEQRRAVACEYAEPEAVALVSQLDLPFAIATIGIRANVANPTAAQSLAEALLSRAQTTSLSLPQPACEAGAKEVFLRYAQDMQSFYHGNHPWAPGCGVVQDNEGLRLSCRGTGAPGRQPGS